ncbi:MAG: hypothetical protein P8177_06530 [Gemmatimonadota bacterium]|jgi:hypothetical protein
MRRPSKILTAPIVGVAVLVSALPFVGCDEYEIALLPVVDSVRLYSLARPEYTGFYSAFDFFSPTRVVVEQAKLGAVTDFDMAFSEMDGQFVMLPAGIFQTFDITPGMIRIDGGVAFDEYDEAPSDGYVTDEPVPLEVDALYVVRSRAVQLSSGPCTRYGKFQVKTLDPEGTVEFRFLRNNRCNDRLVTEED